jgi:hypothetical protein
VSIDGRRETVYSNEVLQKHLSFYYVPSTVTRFLEEARPDDLAPTTPACRPGTASGRMGGGVYGPSIGLADATW